MSLATARGRGPGGAIANRAAFAAAGGMGNTAQNEGTEELQWKRSIWIDESSRKGSKEGGGRREGKRRSAVGSCVKGKARAEGSPAAGGPTLSGSLRILADAVREEEWLGLCRRGRTVSQE